MIINNENVNELKFNNLDVETLRFNGEVVWYKSMFDWKKTECDIIEYNYPRFKKTNSIFVRKGSWCIDENVHVSLSVDISYGETLIVLRYGQVGRTLYKKTELPEEYTAGAIEETFEFTFNDECNVIEFLNLPNDREHGNNLISNWKFRGFDDLRAGGYLDEFEAWITGNILSYSLGYARPTYDISTLVDCILFSSGSWLTNMQYLNVGQTTILSVNKEYTTTPYNINMKYINLTLTDVYSGDYSYALRERIDLFMRPISYSYTYMNKDYSNAGIKTYIIVKDDSTKNNFLQYLKDNPFIENIIIIIGKTLPSLS